jgi:hypothetical protein
MAKNIYQKPVYINAVNHKKLVVRPNTDYKFAMESNSSLIVTQDFQEASKFFPLVFSKDQEGQLIAVAVLGLKDGENLFVDELGTWRTDTYIPAYFRRYPFILATMNGQEKEKKYAVCVDEAYDGYNSNEGMKLYGDDGKETEEFKKTIELLKAYQAEFDNTKRMIELLQDYNLLKTVSANISLPGGEKHSLGGLLMVDEPALRQLDSEKLMNLVKPGYIGLIYAHILSLSNFKLLMALASRRLEK